MSELQPRPVDLLIEARWVVPVEPHAVVLENHAVVVDKDVIVAILPIADAGAAYAPRERVELGEQPHP
jgi:5-methylthioadenosine/S-adenosylhomocysteine deaminase